MNLQSCFISNPPAKGKVANFYFNLDFGKILNLFFESKTPRVNISLLLLHSGNIISDHCFTEKKSMIRFERSGLCFKLHEIKEVTRGGEELGGPHINVWPTFSALVANFQPFTH